MVNIKLGGIGVKHIKNCITCGVVLEAPKNWWISFVDKKHYKCRSCYDTRRTENKIKRMYKDGKQPSPKLLAKFLGTKHREEYSNVTQGQVYIISNSAWEGWLKIGMAIDAKDRCNQYQTSSPHRDYKLCYSKFFDNKKEAEQQAHNLVSEIAEERKGEWFKITKDKAQQIIESL